MWQETNLFGIYFSPLLVYALVALLIWMPLRYALLRFRLGRYLGNVAIAQMTLYLCVLAGLVTWL